MAAKNDEIISLKSLFENALQNYVDITSGSKPYNEVQPLIKTTIQELENATRLINAAQIYSSNELLEEVPTENIQYLAIPCMLGNLVSQLNTGSRFSNLEVSEVYYKDFLQRGKEYGLVPENLKVQENKVLNEKENLTRQVMDRKEKLRKYEEQKQLESDLVRLKKNLEWADEEDRRKYFTLFVKGMVSFAEEELKSISMEKPLAEMRQKDPDLLKKQPKRPPSQPLQPVIITRNELEKKVFGLGYPSVPTMTVDEFYEERVREGIFPSGPSKYANSLQERENPEIARQQEEDEDTRRDAAEDNDDPEELERKRQMDEFKDEHRRGYGNRYNRS